MVEMTAVAEGYEFPDDLDGAEKAYQDLVFEVQSIQEQLGNRNRTHADGTRFTDAEYWEWRHRAAGAWRHQMDELRALKVHLRGLRQAAFRAPERPATGGVHLVNLLVIAYREGRMDEVARYAGEIAETWEVR